MKRFLALSLFVVWTTVLTGQSPPSDPPVGSTVSELKEFSQLAANKIKSLNDKVKGMETTIVQLKDAWSKNETKLKALSGQIERSETVQKELDRLQTAQMKLANDFRQANQQNDERNRLAEQTAQLNKRLEIEVAKVDVIVKEIEAYRPSTRVLSKRVGGGGGVHPMRVELEAQIEGKRIPLKNQMIVAYRQVKEGPLVKFDQAVTDENGVVHFRFDTRTWERPSFIIYRFSGNTVFRESESNRVFVK